MFWLFMSWWIIGDKFTASSVCESIQMCINSYLFMSYCMTTYILNINNSHNNFKIKKRSNSIRLDAI